MCDTVHTARTGDPRGKQVLGFRADVTLCAVPHGNMPQGARTLDVPQVAAISKPESQTMLETVAVILLILWALGLVSSYTLGGFIHLLLVVAIVVILIRLIQGRRL